ncbi:matrixin family metalloprotease [Haloechinothrix sp. YIM 98757]|uniref:Matrixin family metalloprotease n=1 Tax=Haloechinothrix aidingensis TaxID=2752311 RepID=A0A837ZTZ8_9PSEU|nr:matrixin family metalloprotease [Haloechinothrix aidingensis]MBA0124056.1 matrixin family metalloprotease [Haloechinothrix aidingensis]
MSAARQRLEHNPPADAAERTGRVDWGDDARGRPVEPVQAEGKRARENVEVTIELAGFDDVATDDAELTMLETHRPRNASARHIERRWKPAGSVQQVEVPPGDHVIVVARTGYRPYATMVSVRRAQQRIRIAPPRLPLGAGERADELLRPGERHSFVDSVRTFLHHFGYLETRCECRPDQICQHVEVALRRFQRAFGMAATGGLTIGVLRSMHLPRCAVPDVSTSGTGEGSRTAAAGAGEAVSGPGGTTEEDPIVFSANHWDDHELTYRKLGGTADVTNEWSMIRAAMQSWADVSPLNFTGTTVAPSHLEFDFRDPSEDDYPFDKGGSKDYNTYARGFYPGSGLVEFDDHEDWGDLSLEATAAHEIGHAIGLRHSSVEDSTMYPYYHEGWKDPKEVDIRGVKSLYAPVVRRDGPFISYPMWAVTATGGTDTVTIDLGRPRNFLAWGVITLVDAQIDLDRDNMCFMDIFEVDGVRTDWRAAQGDHFGSPSSPANPHQPAYSGRGRNVMFRLVAGHVADLEIGGYALVLVLDEGVD